MTADRPYNPEGLYTIAATGEQAEVYYVSYELSSEVRVCALPEGAHEPLNELLAHISVLELSHLAEAAARGQQFTVDPLDDILPRPGWKLATRAPDAPSEYTLQRMDDGGVQRGARRHLLLLLELAVRSALAPHVGQPAPRRWVQRLRDVHPELRAALGEEALFENKDANGGA
jgi:hypothetical protein